ncbi:MAG: T9SS type A sorting domain-containing protein, partial [candidate division WOR-3 bacterium]
ADPLQRLFAARGNKQPDLYAFDPVALGWEPKAPWPNGTEAKPPSKGATSTPYPDPTGKLYVLKGNNTLGFWSYDVNADSWKQLADIPQGTGKKIKGGSDLVYHDGKVYCLKGITNEFLAYDVASDSWQALPAVPAPNPKFDKGSWLCLDEAAGKVYCHQAKYHAFYAYDIAGGTWGAALKGMPTINSLGKKKKSKDGGSGTFRNDNIFAFKGGNTCEFWKYAINGDSWSELTEIPLTGLSGAKKKVKGGGDLVALNPQPNPLIYALKGNKTNEIWKYESFAALSINPRAARSGVMAVTTDNRRLSLSVSPNPLATGFATLSYNLPQPGAATVHVYDAAGRAVLVRSLAVGRTGQVGLDLRSLSAGVYLVKLSTESLTATHKLVVER